MLSSLSTIRWSSIEGVILGRWLNPNSHQLKIPSYWYQSNIQFKINYVFISSFDLKKKGKEIIEKAYAKFGQKFEARKKQLKNDRKTKIIIEILYGSVHLWAADLMRLISINWSWFVWLIAFKVPKCFELLVAES